MSLPADNAVQNPDPAESKVRLFRLLPPKMYLINNQSSANNSHSGSDGDSDKEHSRKRKLSSRSSVANEVAVRQHPKRPKESDVPEREEDLEESPPTTSASAAAAMSKSGQVVSYRNA